jgi:hypothetical protein
MADLQLVRDLSSTNGHLAVFTTTRPDLSVHGSLVSAGVLEDPVTGGPSIGVVAGGDARKLRYLRQSGRATVVFVDGFRWVAVEGSVRLEGPDDPRTGDAPADLSQLLRHVFQAAGGTHENWEEFDRVMAAERRCAVFVHAERITSNG